MARATLAQCAAADKPCILVLARPYHMDPGIGHEIEVDLQAYGYPVLWTIACYLEKYCAGIVANKKASAAPACPLLGRS